MIKNSVVTSVAIGGVLFKNTFWLTLGQIFNRGTKLLLVVIAARVLGAELYGQFSYILAFLSLFFIGASAISVLGPFVRDISEGGEHQREKEYMFSLKLFLALSALIISFLIYFYINKNADLEIVVLLGLSMALDFIREYYVALLQAKNSIYQQGFSDIIQSVILVLLLGITYFGGITLFGLATIYLTLSVVSLSYILFVLKDKVFYKFFISWEVIKNILKSSWYFGLAWALTIAFYQQILIVILGQFGSSKEVGIYAVASQIITIIGLPAIFLGVSLVPIISSLKRANNKSQDVIYYLTVMSLVITVPIAVFLWVFSPQIVPAIFGTDFTRAGQVVRWLSISVPFLYMVILGLHLLMAADSLHVYIKRFFIASFLAFAVSGVLISEFLLIGAVISYSTLLILITIIVIWPWLYSLQTNHGVIVKVLTIVFTYVVSVYAGYQLLDSSAYSYFAAGLLYIFLCGLFLKKEYQIIKKIYMIKAL